MDGTFRAQRTDNGATAEMRNSWAVASGRDVRAAICGTAGTVHIDRTRGKTSLPAYSQDGYGPPVDTEAIVRPNVSANRGWHFPSADTWHRHGNAQVGMHTSEVEGAGWRRSARSRRGGRRWS